MNIKVKVGQYYEFFDPEKETLTIGKALAVDGDVVNYAVYYGCADYFGTKLKPYHSQFELIRSDDQAKEFTSNIKRQVKVLRAAEFRKLEISERTDTFFFRQRIQNRNLEPELSKMCICGTVWSPLDNNKTEECPHCQALFHLECMRQHSDLRCVECKTEIPKNLVYSHLRYQKDDIRDCVEAPTQKRIKTEELSHIAVTEPEQIQTHQKLAFPSLTPEISNKLEMYIGMMKARKSNEIAMSISQSERTRQSVRENFTQALLLASCEKSQSSQLDLKTEEELCYKIALKIESAMYIYFDKIISKEYGKKFRVLQTTLQATENQSLRASLLSGQLDPNELTRLNPDLLIAPEKLSQKNLEAQKIFNENVVKPDMIDNKVVVSAQGGLEFLRNRTSSEHQSQPAVDVQHEESQNESQPSLMTHPQVDTYGMSSEVFEQWTELGQRWNAENIARRLQERISEHLTTNQITRDNLLQQVQIMLRKQAAVTK